MKNQKGWKSRQKIIGAKNMIFCLTNPPPTPAKFSMGKKYPDGFYTALANENLQLEVPHRLIGVSGHQVTDYYYIHRQPKKIIWERQHL